MLAILGFQPIYNACIENYLVPTSRIIGERGEVTTEGARDAIMSRRIMLLLPFPVLLGALLSQRRSDLPVLLHSSSSPLSVCLVILILPPVPVIFFLYPVLLCLPPLFWGTWHPRAPVKYNCLFACVYVCEHSCTHRALAVWSHSIRFA